MKKVNCTDCANFKDEKCTKQSKNGYNNCKVFKAIPMDTLKKEYYKLLSSGEDNERKNYLENIIKEFNGGTI